MNWQRHSTLYQLTHWWHWLCYGNNANAMTATAGVAALVGLVFYTLYTRKMMEISRQTRVAEVIPYFVQVSYKDLDVFSFSMTLTNVGAHAIEVTMWEQHVNGQFHLSSMFIENKQKMKTDRLGLVRKDKDITIQVAHGAAPKHLVVIEFKDTAQKRHQFQVLRLELPNFTSQIECNGVLPLEYLPLSKTWRARARNWWVIRQQH